MYQKENFSKCLFNPNVEDILGKYSQLAIIKQVYPSITNQLMKYIIVVYDYNSPIVYNNRDLKTRKQQGAEFAGYDLLKDDLNKIFNLEEDGVLKAVDCFLKSFIHSRTWYMICSNESIFWEYGQRMLKPVGNQEEGGKPMSEKDLIAAMTAKTKLSEDMASIDERLDTAYKKLYGDENQSRFLNRATTPEQIAKERGRNV
jgi:hypothetical protein